MFAIVFLTVIGIITAIDIVGGAVGGYTIDTIKECLESRKGIKVS